MPITSSAKKALRASKKKRVYNVRHREAILSVTKEVRKLVASKKAKDAMKLLPKAYAELDKAAKTGFIKKNTADRKKSRLSALVKKSV
jgi:small subunit ribosomal protein S20